MTLLMRGAQRCDGLRYRLPHECAGQGRAEGEQQLDSLGRRPALLPAGRMRALKQVQDRPRQRAARR